MAGQGYTDELLQFGQDQQLLQPSPQGLRVDVEEYLGSVSGESEAAPRDVFAARDLAVRASRQCLDAVFLYSRRSASITQYCGVVAHDGGGPVYRCVLEHDRDSKTEDEIFLPFVRPVPPDWADSLHWYRIGTTTPKHEAGIVNLWTAAEILAERGSRLGGAKLDTVIRSTGAMSSLFLFYDEHLYFARAARAYAERYNLLDNLDPPESQAPDGDLISWWIELCLRFSFRELDEQVFHNYPHLAYLAWRVRLWVSYGAHLYKEHKTTIGDNLRWIYGCRNDVVHEGRQHISGAAVARRLLAEYLGGTLRRSLAMRARGSISTPSESFHLAAEMEVTVVEMLADNRLLDALLYLA